MALFDKHLFVNKSTLPGAGNGLFTRVSIPKGSLIVEYKGRVMTWKQVEAMADDRIGYVFYINSKHVIDAWAFKRSKARYANDARGLYRKPEITNNSEYHVFKKRCFIKATKNIPAGSEIFVGYGAEYWQVIRYNIRLEQKSNHSGKKLPNLPHQDPKQK